MFFKLVQHCQMLVLVHAWPLSLLTSIVQFMLMANEDAGALVMRW